MVISVRLQIAAMAFMMVQAVLFGVGMLLILLTPMSDHASFYIPVMIAVTAIAAAAISWEIAPRFRERYWRARGVDHDAISG
jgi:hypothetical protein